MKSTNMLERLNQELKRRSHVVRIFPNAESCLRLTVTDDSGKSQRQIDNYPCYVPLNRGWSLRKSPNHVSAAPVFREIIRRR
jgi:hypothetical protein